MVIILKILFVRLIKEDFVIGFDFSPIIDAASARTNSPRNAPIFFNAKNTSFTVDPGFSRITSRRALLSSLPSVVYTFLSLFQSDEAQTPTLQIQEMTPLCGNDGSLVA